LATSGNGAASKQPESENGTGKRAGSPVAVGRLLITAYVAVTGVAAAFGGTFIAVQPFTRGGKSAIVVTILLMVALILLVAAVLALVKIRRVEVINSVGVLVGIVVAALVVGGVIGFLSQTSNSGQNSPAASAAGPCAQPLTITSPANGTKIVGKAGVTLTIVACGLTAGETGWLFDYQSGTYGLDNGGPVVTGDGTSTFDDEPVGDPGDVDQEVTLTLVLANSACGTALEAIDFDDNPPALLPTACRIESQVAVSETY
jgi:hypothetical protein